MQIQILPGRRMRWRERKDRFGSREERHKLGKFILKYCNPHLPVTAWVDKLERKQKFSFAPVLINGQAKKVVFYHNYFMVCMDIEDTEHWIQSIISSNRLYDLELYHCNI